MVRLADATLLALVGGVAVLLIGCGGEDGHGHDHDDFKHTYECAAGCKVEYSCHTDHAAVRAEHDTGGHVHVDLKGCAMPKLGDAPFKGDECEEAKKKFDDR